MDMKNEYLIIEDEHIIKKLEELLWFDEININSKVDAMLLIEYLNNRLITKKIAPDYRDAVSELRRFLFSELSHTATTDDLNKYIDKFLFLLRIDKQEASLCLDRFLDVVLANISILYKEKCFKRLTCILYIIYQVQFQKNTKENQLSEYTFANNVKALHEEDKNYLINIFICENDYNGLTEIIRSYSELDSDKKSEEVPTSDSARAMFGKIVFIMNKYINRAKEGVSIYENVYCFLEKIKSSDIGETLKNQAPGFSNYLEFNLLQFAPISEKNDAVSCEKDRLTHFFLK